MIGVSRAARRAVAAERSPKLVFVGRQDLHTRVLAQYLSGALSATCHFDHESYRGGKTLPYALILFDCKHHDHDAISIHLEELYQTDPDSCVVLLNATSSSRVEALIHWPCLKGIFFDDCSQELLLKGMHRVLRGEIWMPRQLVEQCFERQREAMPPSPRIKVKLSRRELDILRCITRADSNADIASKLHISEHTVKSHIYNIFRKIEVRNRTEASHWAMRYLKEQN
jgi:LuxR family transcriptional regulator, csgAB operon transcriptional regulatory protein